MAAFVKVARAGSDAFTCLFRRTVTQTGNITSARPLYSSVAVYGQQSVQGFKSDSEIIGVRARELHGVKIEDLPPLNPYACPICSRNISFTYKDVLFLSQFITKEGHMINRRITGVCRKQQRQLEKKVKIAQRLGILPNVTQVMKAEEELKSS